MGLPPRQRYAALRSAAMEDAVDTVLAALHPDLRARCTAATIVCLQGLFKDSGATTSRACASYSMSGPACPSLDSLDDKAALVGKVVLTRVDGG